MMIMMKVSLLLASVPLGWSFSSLRTSHHHLLHHHQSSSTTTPLHASNIDRIKSAGAGIPCIPAGGRALFDPAQEGKLGGTSNLDDRISTGPAYLPDEVAVGGSSTSHSTTTDIPTTNLQDAQHWLEDIGLPLNFAKPTAPVAAKVLGRARLITDNAPGDIQHVVLQLPEGMHYVEGQSLSVIPDGIDPKTGKGHKPRLYSIASTRYGDLLDGRTVSLCVRRAEYVDPATGLVDPTKKGVCSNFLCDAKPGDVIQVAGPVGKTMLLPEDGNRDVICVATGTGIAPFRGFMHRLFMENTVARHMFNGKFWLILGVPTTGGLLYPQELEAMQANANGQLEVTYAISREMTNKQGGKLYVQHVLQERADELFEKLNNGAVIYFCGLKGMMPGILEALEQVATERGIDWAKKMSELKANDQWHVEVY